MTEVVQALQVLFVLAWSLPLVVFRAYAWRKSVSAVDRLRAAVWYTALAVAAFPVRWLFFPTPVHHMPENELAVWAALYLLGSLTAAWLTRVVQEVCHAGIRD